MKMNKTYKNEGQIMQKIILFLLTLMISITFAQQKVPGSLEALSNGRVRSEGGLSGAVMGGVTAGQKMLYDEEKDGWYHMTDETGTDKGWVYKSVVKVLKEPEILEDELIEPASKESKEKKMGKLFTISNGRVRNTPSRDGSVIDGVTKGATLSFTEKKDDWFHLSNRYGEDKGWIYKSVVRVVSDIESVQDRGDVKSGVIAENSNNSNITDDNKVDSLIDSTKLVEQSVGTDEKIVSDSTSIDSIKNKMLEFAKLESIKTETNSTVDSLFIIYTFNITAPKATGDFDLINPLLYTLSIENAVETELSIPKPTILVKKINLKSEISEDSTLRNVNSGITLIEPRKINIRNKDNQIIVSIPVVAEKSSAEKNSLYELKSYDYSATGIGVDITLIFSNIPVNIMDYEEEEGGSIIFDFYNTKNSAEVVKELNIDMLKTISVSTETDSSTTLVKFTVLTDNSSVKYTTVKEGNKFIISVKRNDLVKPKGETLISKYWKYPYNIYASAGAASFVGIVIGIALGGGETTTIVEKDDSKINDTEKEIDFLPPHEPLGN